MPDVGRDCEADLAVYGTLVSRYMSNVDLTWRMTGNVFVLEALIFAGLAAFREPSILIALGIFGLLVGVAGAATMRRCELASILDRVLLDKYEAALFAGRVPPVLTLDHTKRLPDRLAALDRREAQEVFYGGSRHRWPFRVAGWFDRRLMLYFPASLWWVFLSLLLAAASPVAAVIHLTALSPSPP